MALFLFLPLAWADPAMNRGVAQGHALRYGAPTPARPAAVAIIIDDLGEQRHAGLRAIALPGPVAVAFLPDAAYTRAQAALAHAHGKEVLLHLPLEPGGGARRYPASLTAGASAAELAAYFARALASVPHARGVNNHQGSLSTSLMEPMRGLMAEIRRHPGLYFVDSRTGPASVAYKAARAEGVPAAERSVFLDNERGEAAVRRAFAELVAKARRNERALGIGHPYPETFAVLREEIPRLAAAGIHLVSPSELIARQGGWRAPYKRLKLSPTLTLATSTPGRARQATTTAAAR